MTLLIKGMEMPKEGRLTLQISADGAVYVVNSCDITAETYMTDAVPVSPHGRLIDADAFLATIRPCSASDEFQACTFLTVKRLLFEHIEAAPTVMEAEE